MEITGEAISEQSIGRILRAVTRQIKQYLEFDLSALAIMTPGSNEVCVSIGTENGERLQTRRFPKAYSQHFELLDGNLVLVSRMSEGQDVRFVHKVYGESLKKLKSGLTVPVANKNLGQGSLLIGSYRDELLHYKRTFENLNVDEILDQSVKQLSDFPASTGEEGGIEAYYQTLFEYSGTAVAVIEDDKTISRVNKEFEQLTGYTREEIEGKMSFVEFLHPKEWERIVEYHNKRMEDPRSIPRRYEFVLRRKDGADRIIDITASPIPDTDKVIASLLDITENREAEKEIKEFGERLVIINDIISAINTKLSLKKLIAITFSRIKKIFDYNIAGIILLEPAAEELEIHICDEKGNIQVLAGDASSRMEFEKFLAHKRKISTDPEMAYELYQSCGIPLEKTINSHLLMSLVAEKELIGAFSLASENVGAFSQYHLDMFRGICNQIAAAIVKTKLYQQHQDALGRLSVLEQINKTICSRLDIDEVIKLVLDSAQRALDARIATIRFVDVEHLPRKVVSGFRDDMGTSRTLKSNERLSRIVQEQRPLVVEDIQADPNILWDRTERVKDEQIRSFLGVPVISRGKTIAILSVYTEKVRHFDERDIELLSTIANQAAIAIENARLYEEIKETKEHLENLLKSSVDAIISTDQKGLITFFSKGAENMFGYKEEEVQGKSFFDFFLRERPDSAAIPNDVLKGEKLQHHETEVLTKSGNKLPVNWSISLMKDVQKNVIGVLGIGKDISERKQVENEIRKKSDELENFVYLVSHNLKTPLVSLEGFVSILLGEYGDRLDLEGKHYLQRIQKNTEYMERMIQDLLEFSKIGRMERTFEEASAAEIINGVIEQFRFQIVERGIKILITENLPVIYCDGEGLGTVFSNLISNSIKYMGDTQKPRIEIGYEDKGQEHLFWVKDNGMGIDEKYHEKVFTLFQRLHGIKEIDGTGVGLAIVKRIVENHKGTVRLSSQLGTGTTCYFTLPKFNPALETEKLKKKD